MTPLYPGLSPRVEYDYIAGQPAGKALVEAGLLPPETKWCALKLNPNGPVMMQAELHIDRDHYAHIGQTIPELIEQGILPPRTVSFVLDAALDRVVTIKAEWVLSASQYFHVLSILTKEVMLIP